MFLDQWAMRYCIIYIVVSRIADMMSYATHAAFIKSSAECAIVAVVLLFHGWWWRKKSESKKKVLFPPMQIHIHTSQLHYFSISLFKAKNCVKSRLSFYLYVHTHFNDCNCLPFRWIFLISFTRSSRLYFSSFIINLWFEANWNVDASFNQRFDATSVCFCCRKNCSELKLKVFNLFALITAQKD